MRVRMPVCEISGDLYVFDPGRERVFKFIDRTDNPRVLAAHDAVVWNEGLLTIHTDGAFVKFQHHVAGIEESTWAAEFLDEPVAYFDEVNHLYEGEVAAWMEEHYE